MIEQRTVETAHGAMGYSAIGSGEAIVLLPGFQSERSGFVERGYPGLLAGYRTLCVDPIGFGLSAKPHEQAAYTAPSVVGHVTALLDAEGIDKAHIWGFSRGGAIAGLCAELAPDRCLSVVMGAIALGGSMEQIAPSLLRGVEFLANNDWAGYWGDFPLPLPKQLTDHFELINDPVANAVALRETLRWYDEFPDFGLGPGPVARFAYFGQGEVFADGLRSVLSDAPVESHEGAWAGHAETMMDPEGVVAVVADFLARRHSVAS